MTRDEFILAVLACGDGSLLSPAQLNKALFLAVQRLPPSTNCRPPFDFTVGDFGPCDPQIAAAAGAMSSAGLLTVEPAGIGRSGRIALTDAGRKAGLAILDGLGSDLRRSLHHGVADARSRGYGRLRINVCGCGEC